MDKTETKICQNCQVEFQIEPEDFVFYDKMKVPAPTWCPECRLVRRMVYRNERTLYKRSCLGSGHNEEIFSIYAPEKKLNVVCDKFWWSDNWDPYDFGRDYDFSKPFFIQFRELLERVPIINLSITNMVNCSYCNVCEGDKDSYLISATEHNEHVLYSNRVTFNKDCSDLYVANKNNFCYELVSCNSCYKVCFSEQSNQCTNSSFLFACINCSDCIACTNLRNKSYCIGNQQYSKEEYQKLKKEFDVSTYSGVKNGRALLAEVKKQSIYRYANIFKSVNVTGDNVGFSKNCHYCFDLVEPPAGEDSKFCHWGGNDLKDSYDAGPGVGWHGGQMYEVVDSGIQSSQLRFCVTVYGSLNIYYSINCHSSKSLFGCYGIRHGEYSILNRVYTKEEYEKLLPRIIKHMEEMPYIDKNGRVYKFGEFFPIDLSLFAYNETVAEDYFPMSKKEILEAGFNFRDTDEKIYQATLLAEKIPDKLTDVSESITKEIIGCLCEGKCDHQCTKAFRITKDELLLHKTTNFVLPKRCFNCRHQMRLKQRNPLKLWPRTCQCAGAKSSNGIYTNTIQHSHGITLCPTEFETSYAPDRPEIVYCEQCYQQEVV
ncbi:hypothetical protein HY061_03365 [Candidatus Azambacteria bacterium]|nr:hypothetical protein [Candidatus Azambacteria bacterium]